MAGLQPPGDKMKKVLCWASEMLNEHPEKKRVDIFREAEIRFDLTPRECEFLDNHFVKGSPENQENCT